MNQENIKAKKDVGPKINKTFDSNPLYLKTHIEKTFITN